MANSITLALATLGFVNVPGPPVEAMIAMSILLLATEIVRAQAGSRRPHRPLHGLRYERPTYWTKMHWRWINELRKFRYPHQQIAFEELKRAIRQIEDRIRTLDLAIEDAVKPWRFAPVVDALGALHGVNTMIAATLAAEIGDIGRFSNPRQLMAWLGLVPSEHSSGSTIRRGRITRTGNALARTMMVEASWSYRHLAVQFSTGATEP